MNKEWVDKGKDKLHKGLLFFGASVCFATMTLVDEAPDSFPRLMFSFAAFVVMSIGAGMIADGIRMMFIGAHEPATEAEPEKAATPVAASSESR